MTTVTKRDLVAVISTKTGMDADNVGLVVNELLTTVADKLAEGSEITLRGFCTITVRIAAAKIGQNPLNPKEKFSIPERCVVHFKPSSELKERVGKLSPKKLRRR